MERSLIHRPTMWAMGLSTSFILYKHFFKYKMLLSRRYWNILTLVLLTVFLGTIYIIFQSKLIVWLVTDRNFLSIFCCAAAFFINSAKKFCVYHLTGECFHTYWFLVYESNVWTIQDSTGVIFIAIRPYYIFPVFWHRINQLDPLKMFSVCQRVFLF